MIKIKNIYENSLYDVENLHQNEDSSFKYAITSFWNETEPTGGRISGKKYRDAIEFVNEYINNLKLEQVS